MPTPPPPMSSTPPTGLGPANGRDREMAEELDGLGCLDGKDVALIKSGKLAPKTKVVVAALIVAAVAVAVFTGFGAAGIGIAGVAFAAMKASAVLSAFVATVAAAIVAIAIDTIQGAQKQHRETMDGVLGSENLKAVPSQAQATILKRTQSEAKNKVSFQNEVRRNQAAQQVFRTIQNLFPVKNFEIPIDQKMAILDLIKHNPKQFEAMFSQYLTNMEKLNRHSDLHQPLLEFLTGIQAMGLSNRSQMTITSALGNFHTLLLNAKGLMSFAQSVMDEIALSVETVEDLRARFSDDNHIALREQNQRIQNQEIADAFSERDREFAQAGYTLKDEYGMWVQNSWTREENNKTGLVVVWKGDFAFRTNDGPYVKKEKIATLDLSDLGSLSHEQQILAMQFVERMSSDITRLELQEAKDKGRIPPDYQSLFYKPETQELFPDAFEKYTELFNQADAFVTTIYTSLLSLYKDEDGQL